jgi:hypothetical protein
VVNGLLMVVVVKSEPNGGAGNFTVFAYAYCFNDAISGLKIWNSQYFHIFVRGGGVDKYLRGVLLLPLAGAWWQRPERPRKKFNKICFLGLHGKI